VLGVEHGMTDWTLDYPNTRGVGGGEGSRIYQSITITTAKGFVYLPTPLYQI